MKLTLDQEHVVGLDEGCFLVQAPPGAGKTTVLTERIARILRASPSEAFRILALTFTTKAAENLKDRLESVGSPNSQTRVHASTFHAFSLETLRSYGSSVGFTSRVTPYSNTEELRSVLEAAANQLGFALPGDRRERRTQIGNWLEEIGRRKRDLSPPKPDDQAPEAQLYWRYNALLREYEKCDFDDLLYGAWRLLVDEPSITNHLSRIYRYVVVDEAQDTSRVQYEILKLLCGRRHRNVMLVADENQAIHGYAGASPEWLARFCEDFGAVRLSIRSNFRSAGLIVRLAQGLCPSESEPRTYATGWVGYVELDNEEKEGAFAVDWLTTLVGTGLPSDWLEDGEDGALALGDCAVLARNNAVLEQVHLELHRRGIGAAFLGGTRSVVDSRQATTLLRLLQFIQNPRDGIARSQLRELVGLHPDTDAAVGDDEFIQSLATTRWGQRVAEVFADLRTVADVSDMIPRAVSLLRAVGRADVSADADELERRWVAYRRELLPTQRSLDGFIGHLALAGRNALEREGVRLLTIHSAKGLEFRVVVLIGMNDGTLPDWRATEAELPEETRLAYVAVTRAARALLITRAKVTTTRYGTTKPNRPSRFLSAMSLSPTEPSVAMGMAQRQRS